MKTGKTLVELATEIQRQAEQKRDFIVPTENTLMAVRENNALTYEFGDQALSIGDTAHTQIGQHVGIPKAYYDRMKAEQPVLLAANVNTWMHANPSRQMVRTLDGKARAFLSDKYRPLDNAQLAEAVLPVLMDLNCEILSCEVTERRLYIKAVDAKVQRDIPAGHHIGDGTHTIVKARELHPTVTISNSEIGYGSLSVQGGTFDRFCTNLAIFGERSMKKYHVGQRFGEFTEEQVYALLTDQTRALNDAAIWATVRDVVKGAFDQAKFDALVDKIVDTQAQPLEGDVPKIVEVTAKQFGFNDGERKSVLDHLIKGGDLSRFGLYNAVTRTAEDLLDYDRATEFERIGGKIIELPKTDWEVLAKAA